jgi:hypothetical protein
VTGPSDVSRPQDFDPRYVAARRVLLDALTVLAPHGDAVILAGAQAVYLQTGAADLAIAPYTTDGDLVLDPLLLGEVPELEAGMSAAGFHLQPQPGGHAAPRSWLSVDEDSPPHLGSLCPRPPSKGGASVASVVSVATVV